MDNNIWQRRSNSGKLTLSANSNGNRESSKGETRTFTKRHGASESSSHGRSNPFNNPGPATAAPVLSPTAGASSAFGLGSGAFASFGSSKPTKASSNTSEQTPSDGADRETAKEQEKTRRRKSSVSLLAPNVAPVQHPIRNSWVVWYRPPTAKHLDYEKSTIALAAFGTVESFWAVFSHLRRPSSLPAVSDYHLFKKGIRPVWEDEENKRGGKWVVRLKKGVADRYWEDLLLAIVGDQFAEAGEEVCGLVLSVRSGEDVLSIWTRIDGGRNIKIRETVKRVLAFPADTNIVWKSHDDSIAQRSAYDQARHEKGNGHPPHGGKRRDTLVDEGNSERIRK